MTQGEGILGAVAIQVPTGLNGLFGLLYGPELSQLIFFPKVFFASPNIMSYQLYFWGTPTPWRPITFKAAIDRSVILRPFV